MHCETKNGITNPFKISRLQFGILNVKKGIFQSRQSRIEGDLHVYLLSSSSDQSHMSGCNNKRHVCVIIKKNIPSLKIINIEEMLEI